MSGALICHIVQPLRGCEWLSKSVVALGRSSGNSSRKLPLSCPDVAVIDDLKANDALSKEDFEDRRAQLSVSKNVCQIDDPLTAHELLFDSAGDLQGF